MWSLICVTIASTAIKAQTFTEGKLAYSIEHGKAVLTGFAADQFDENLVIPATVAYNGTTYPVAEVAMMAFQGQELVTLVLGENVESMGLRAFGIIPTLTSVTLNSRLSVIGMQAFMGDKGLKSITIPGGVTTVDENAFYNSGLESCRLPAGLKAIPNGTFANCPLTSIDIPASVTYIGDDAFFKSQFAEVKLPDGLRHIGDGAFYDSKLTSITIPEGVDTVGNTCFGHCFSLLTVDFGPGVKVIGSSAINYAGPTKVILHEGLVEVQNLGISLCPDLTEIVLPSTLQKIGPKAFARCPFKSVVAKMPTPPAITEDVATRAFSDWTNYNGDSLYDYCTLPVPRPPQSADPRLFTHILAAQLTESLRSHAQILRQNLQGHHARELGARQMP